MEKTGPYFLAGLFVSTLVLIMTGFLIWLISPHGDKDYTRYIVYFTESVSGLKEGASVQYRGVEVGKVMDIYLSPEHNELVKVNIEVAEDTPVRAHTRAMLGIAGMTGLVYMELTTMPDDMGSPQVRNNEPYPVLEGSGTQVSQILDNINKFSIQGLDQIISMSRETQAMTKSIRKLSDKIQKDPSQILYQQNTSGVEIPR